MTKSNKQKDDLKYAFNRLGSGFGIVMGLFLMVDGSNQNSFWKMMIGALLVLGGLDWRFNSHTVMADITIRRQVERDPDMEFTDD